MTKDNRDLPIEWGMLVPFVLLHASAVPLAAWSVWKFGFAWSEWIAFLLLYPLTALGITAGYHRLYSHRSYEAALLVRIVYAVLGAMALQNSIATWTAQHRWHHRYVDTELDPYNVRLGFWHAHWGWIVRKSPIHIDTRNIQDLMRDPVVRIQSKYYWPIAIAANLAVVCSLGFAYDRVLPFLAIAGLLRVVAVHHGIFLINSATHTSGERPWSKEHTGRDNYWIVPFSMGEAYHNYHHTFEWDYRNGVAWYHWDPTKWATFLLSKVGLAWGLRRAPVDVQLRKQFESKLTALREMVGMNSESKGDPALETAKHEVRLALDELRVQRRAFSEMRARAKSESRKALKEDLRRAKESFSSSRAVAVERFTAWEAASSSAESPRPEA